MPPQLRHPSAAVIAALAYTLYWSLVPLFGDISLSAGTTYWMLWPESVLKGTLLVALFAQTFEVQAALKDGRIQVTRAGLLWSMALVTVAVFLALFRDPMARIYKCATSHLTSHRFVGYDMLPGDRERHEAWMEAWDGGQFLMREVLLALAIGWSTAFIGKLHKGWLATLLSWMTVLFLCGVVAFGFEHVFFTYDIFHDGIFSGPLFAELVFPLPMRVPESVVAAPCLLAFTLASRRLLNGAPSRKHAMAQALQPEVPESGSIVNQDLLNEEDG